MGSRSRSKLPIRDSRKSINSPTNRRTINNTRVLKDRVFLSSGKHKTEYQNPNELHLRDPLTPLHRLRRFKVIRDRNLRKAVLPKSASNRTMSVDVENDDTQGKNPNKDDCKNTNTVIEKADKINGEEKISGGAVEDEEERRDVVNGENGEVSNLEKKDIVEGVAVESKEIEICLTEDISDIVSDVVQETNNEEENKNKDTETGVVSEEEKGSERNDESVKEESVEPPVRVLRRSIRGKATADLAQPTTSKHSVSFEVPHNTHQEPRDTPKSSETIYRMESPRLEGRRSLWKERTGGYNKRKYDYFKDDEYRQGKKQAVSRTPSVLSPGWQFIKSPLTRFWSTQNTPAPGHTPYKSPLVTPYNETNIEDSMAVNFDDKSLYGKLNDTELDVTKADAPKPSSTNSGWNCSIM